MKGRIHHFIQILKSFFPSHLPKGSKEFDDFATSILDLANFPDNKSYRHAIASMLQHLGPLEDKKAKRFFIKSIKSAQVREVAFYKIQELKKLIQEAEKEKEATQAESSLASAH